MILPHIQSICYDFHCISHYIYIVNPFIALTLHYSHQEKVFTRYFHLWLAIAVKRTDDKLHISTLWIEVGHSFWFSQETNTVRRKYLHFCDHIHSAFQLDLILSYSFQGKWIGLTICPRRMVESLVKSTLGKTRFHWKLENSTMAFRVTS